VSLRAVPLALAAVLALAPLGSAAAAPLPRARAVSGAPQSAWGYADVAAPLYDAEFARSLVVSVPGHDGDLEVHFWCASPNCVLPISEQPDSVSRVDPRTYAVKVQKGRAELHLTLGVRTPGTYVVMAAPVVNDKLRLTGAARFVLTVR